MKETLKDIRKKLADNVYKNEEHVRLSLVARIIKELGWDLWNPIEVNSEFAVIPAEDQSRVDLALFLHPYVPSVFLEIKAVGKLEGNISQLERQLRDYNRNNTALFSIITDGRKWRFYYSQTGGEFPQKCFKSLDIIEDDIDDLEISFKGFLSKSEISNGNAKRDAESYLQLNQKQRAMENALPKARRLVAEPPYPSLPDALVQLVAEDRFSITVEEAANFIQETIKRPPVKPTPSRPKHVPPDTLPDIGGFRPKSRAAQIMAYLKQVNRGLMPEHVKLRIQIDEENMHDFRVAWEHPGDSLMLISKKGMRLKQGKAAKEVFGSLLPEGYDNIGRKCGIFIDDSQIPTKKIATYREVENHIWKIKAEAGASLPITFEPQDKKAKTYFDSIDVDVHKQKKVRDNILNRKRLWNVFLEKKQMTSAEFKELSEFRAKAIAGFEFFLTRNGLASRFGDIFTLNEAVIPQIQKLLSESQ